MCIDKSMQTIGQSTLSKLLNSRLLTNKEIKSKVFSIMATDELMEKFCEWMAECKTPTIPEIIRNVNSIDLF